MIAVLSQRRDIIRCDETQVEKLLIRKVVTILNPSFPDKTNVMVYNEKSTQITFFNICAKLFVVNSEQVTKFSS